MKRLFFPLLLLSLLLGGCRASEPVTAEPGTPSQTVTVPATQTTTVVTEATTVPAQTEPELVTVYLLKKIGLFDSGYQVFSYDEAYNLDVCEGYNMDSQPWCTVYFEEKGSDGAAGKLREKWGEDEGQILLVTYTQDGRLLEGWYAGDADTGFQCEYDDRGNLIRKTDYYDGMPDTVVSCEYSGGMLSGIRCEDSEGNPAYVCETEQGRIVKQRCFNADGDDTHSYLYGYDAHGNLTQQEFAAEGEVFPNRTYTYQAVEVDPQRAEQLLRQQHQFLWLLSQYAGL